MKYNKMFLFKKNKERLCCNYSALLVHVNKYNKTIFSRETRRLFYCRYCGKLTIRVARFKSADAPPRRLRERWSPQTTKCYKRLVPGSVRGHTGYRAAGLSPRHSSRVPSSPFHQIIAVGPPVLTGSLFADAPGSETAGWTHFQRAARDTPRAPATAHAQCRADELSRDKCCI